MAASSDLPLWAIPIVMLAFPVACLGIWGLVCAILSSVSGYRSLSPFAISAAEARMGKPLQRVIFAKIGAIAYRGGVLSVRPANDGLTIRVSPFFPFHQAIRLPWDRVRMTDRAGRAAQPD